MSQINNIVTCNGNREPSGKTYKILEANQFMKYTGHYQYPPYSMAVKLETQERKDKSIITAAGMKLLRKKKINQITAMRRITTFRSTTDHI